MAKFPRYSNYGIPQQYFLQKLILDVRPNDVPCPVTIPGTFQPTELHVIAREAVRYPAFEEEEDGENDESAPPEPHTD